MIYAPCSAHAMHVVDRVPPKVLNVRGLSWSRTWHAKEREVTSGAVCVPYVGGMLKAYKCNKRQQKIAMHTTPAPKFCGGCT